MKVVEQTKKEFEKWFVICKETGCWNWSKSLVDGYGQVTKNNKNLAAHRYSYSLYKEDFDSKLLVCHTCDNRKCVNPNHLFLGSSQDNMDDMKSKNRQPDNKGIKNPRSKLTESEVLEIKRIGHSIPYSITARKYRVTP